VAEHSLGKGEVGSSILPMGTRFWVLLLINGTRIEKAVVGMLVVMRRIVFVQI
jgi:hypothetical protein